MERRSAPVDRHDLDRFADALQGDRARLGATELAGGVRERPRAREDLASFGQSADPRCFMDPLARVVQAPTVDRGGVDADPELEREPVRLAVLREPSQNGDRALDGLGRITKRGHEPVARVPNLLAHVLGDQRPERVVVPAHEFLPGLVADRLDQVRGLHDVGEEECRRHSLRRRGSDSNFACAAKQLGHDPRVASRSESLERGTRGLELESCARLVALSPAAWAAYQYERRNTKGPHAERWRHSHGCGRFFNVVRDTTTDRILGSYCIGEPRPLAGDTPGNGAT